MEQNADRVMLNDVLVQAATLTSEQRHARIRRCVTEGRHRWDQLPECVDPSSQQVARYCEQCWSLIDRDGLTWSWPPAERVSA